MGLISDFGLIAWFWILGFARYIYFGMRLSCWCLGVGSFRSLCFMGLGGFDFVSLIGFVALGLVCFDLFDLCLVCCELVFVLLGLGGLGSGCFDLIGFVVYLFVGFG